MPELGGSRASADNGNASKQSGVIDIAVSES